MNIGVIGTPNKDKLILTSGAKVSSWGGIVYNLLTLSHYLKESGSVIPICPVGADLEEEFLALVQRFTNIRTRGIIRCVEKHNRVNLKCINQEEKEEIAEITLPPLSFSQIKPHLKDLDFLLINFTSGRDIEQDTLRSIRREYRGPIYVDVHSLTMSDPDARGKRRLRALRDWQDWLAGFDYVQFTWREANSLTGETKSTIAGLVDIADWLLEHKTKGTIVTRGSEGVYYFHADEQGILKEEVPPFPVQTVVDSTGCGDVFSAAFIFHLIKMGNPFQAAEFAAKAAALKATFSGIAPWLL
ncbi:MAG: carbohydrate kinase family protein [bacterium]|nr:carbohydrate kinase family protein [bacterium]